MADRQLQRPGAGDATAKTPPIDHDLRIADVARSESPRRRAGIDADDILRFPRGAGAGECLHAIFERVDFTDPAGWSDAIDRGAARIRSRLARATAEQSTLLAAHAARMLHDVLRTPLPDGIVLGAACRPPAG